MNAKYHLRPGAARSWVLSLEDSPEATRFYRNTSKQDAIREVVRLLDDTGAHLTIYRLNGTYAEERTFPRSLPVDLVE